MIPSHSNKKQQWTTSVVFEAFLLIFSVLFWNVNAFVPAIAVPTTTIPSTCAPNNNNNDNNDIHCSYRRKLVHHHSSSSSQEQEVKTTINKTNQKFEYALLFDCDGVILETEELHRLAYNAAFEYFHLTIDNEPVHWSVEYYDILQNTVGGGKPKMFFHFRTTMKNTFPMYSLDNGTTMLPAPDTEQEQQQLIYIIQEWKTNEFKRLVEEEAQPRPGILQLMDEALNEPTIAVGVCSAATKEAAVKTLQTTLGMERISKLDVCILGDDVTAKKPDPLIYNTAKERLGLSSNQCVVIEDSIVGLRAAVAAHMKCIITYTPSTANRDFYGEGAAAIVPDLLSRNVTLSSIFDPIRTNGYDNAELLLGKKD